MIKPISISVNKKHWLKNYPNNVSTNDYVHVMNNVKLLLTLKSCSHIIKLAFLKQKNKLKRKLNLK